MLLYDDALPWSFWKLVRVLDLITGRDGKTRGAVVRVPVKNDETTTLRRPLQLLYPLDIKCKEQYEREGKSVEQSTENQVMESPIVRVQRRATVEARDRVNACVIELEDSD